MRCLLQLRLIQLFNPAAIEWLIVSSCPINISRTIQIRLHTKITGTQEKHEQAQIDVASLELIYTLEC